jgi:IS30 family transposase
MAIQALLQAKLCCRAIARQIGFSHATACREVNRGRALP